MGYLRCLQVHLRARGTHPSKGHEKQDKAFHLDQNKNDGWVIGQRIGELRPLTVRRVEVINI
jgi:hypothetical protein